MVTVIAVVASLAIAKNRGDTRKDVVAAPDELKNAAGEEIDLNSIRGAGF